MPIVLVIDDDPHMGLILTRILRKHGFKIMVATDGPSGLALARENCPDLILLDIIMRGMDGIEVAKRLRGDSVCADIPIVFLTAFATAVGRHEASGVGVNGFISKPFVVDDLVQQVKDLTGTAKNGAG
jgi:CheY-like chemotaxis protein